MTRTYLDRVGPTYYFRRVVPEHLRRYFQTKTGKPRSEFKISLGTKDRGEANRLVEVKSVEISARIDAAQRKYDAGITPDQATAQNAAQAALQERYEALQLEVQAIEDQARYATEAAEDAVIAGLNRPIADLTPEQRAMRRLLPPELFDSPEAQAAREARRVAAALEGAKAAAQELKSGTLGKPKHQLDRILERYTEVITPTAATLKKWRTAIVSLKSYLKHTAKIRRRCRGRFLHRRLYSTIFGVIFVV